MIPTFILLCLIFGLIVFLKLKYRSKSDESCIPGPLQLPFFGTTWIKYFQIDNKIHENYEKLNDEFGDIVLEKMGNIEIVSVFNRRDIEKVFEVTLENSFRPPMELTSLYRSSRPDRYSSAGLTNENGELWRFLRKKLTSKTIENRKILSQFLPNLSEICDDLIAEIKARRDKNDVIKRAEDDLSSFVFQSTASFMFGYIRGSTASKIEEKLTLLKEETDNIFYCLSESFYGKC